jgi:DNA processing protein
VEASEKGGALITAAIAASYHREVLSVPGRLTDSYSRGTNNLIATNRALLVRDADDIAFQLGWPLLGRQTEMKELKDSYKLSSDEQKIVNVLNEYDHMGLEEIASATSFSLPKTASHLFNLEMNKVVRTLPGHLYQLI